YLLLNRWDEALAVVRRAEPRFGSGPDQDEQRARAAVIEGAILRQTGDVRGGVAAFDRALAIYRRTPGVEPKKVAAALQNQGLLLLDDRQFDAAEAALQEALAINRRSLGEGHLNTGQTWYALAQNAVEAGKLPEAEQRIGKALAIERVMLAPDNP